jgi:hypothetical protein
MNLKIPARLVKEAPPYVPLRENLRVAVAAPLAVPLPDFPPGVNRAFLALAALALVVLALRRPLPELPGGLLAALAAVFAVNLAYSLYLNYTSVSWFPWAVFPRRLAQYQATVTAVLCALAAGLALEAATRRSARAGAWAGRLLLVAALAALCAPLLTPEEGETRVWRRETPYLSPRFLELTRFLRAEARPGETALANFRTLAYLKYLTGLTFLTEGRSPYQIYNLITRNVANLKEVRRFLRDGDETVLARHNVRFVVICRTNDPAGSRTGLRRVKDEVFEDRRRYRPAFENAEYTVYEVLPAAPGR